MDHAQILAFRLERSGLAGRDGRSLAEAAACPASDFHRDSAVTALAARADGVTREAYEHAVDAGELVVAHVMRAAIHVLRPEDHLAYGSELVGADDSELTAQISGKHALPPAQALAEVTAAVRDALGAGPMDKNELHQAMRERVRPELLLWCEGCQSHHVGGRLWRWATVVAGARLDATRHYLLPADSAVPEPGTAVRGYLRAYGPGTPAEFAEWAGVTSRHAKRLWAPVAEEVDEDGLLREDRDAFAGARTARGVRLLPPGDPFLQKPNRELLAPDPGLRRQLFKPVASPGVVLVDGAVAGTWRARAKSRRLEITVDALARVPRADLAEEAGRVAQARGADEAVLAGV